MTLLDKQVELMAAGNRKPEDCTIDNCIEAYKKFLKVVKNKRIEKKDNLVCWYIDKGYNITNGQYKIYFTKSTGKTGYFKPKLHRMWFYGSKETIQIAEDHENYTVSHLCHNDKCINKKHLVLEDLATNKSRNVCPGGENCNHKPICLRPGHEFNEEAPVVLWSSSLEKMVITKKILCNVNFL